MNKVEEDKQTVRVLYFGGMSPSGAGPAFPVESQSSSRTPGRPLHMLTGRFEHAHSAAVPKTKTPRSGEPLLWKERLNEGVDVNESSIWKEMTERPHRLIVQFRTN